MEIKNIVVDDQNIEVYSIENDEIEVRSNASINELKKEVNFDDK